MVTINSIINSMVSIDLNHGIENADFNNQLAQLQSLIGQSDGMLASMYFDDPMINQWCKGNNVVKKRILLKYIQQEVSLLNDL